MRTYYEDGGIVVYHADCRDVLPGIEVRPDHMISDPPYDLETHDGARRVKAGGGSEAIPIRFPPFVVCTDLHRLLMPKRWSISFCSLEMLGEYRTWSRDWWVRSGFWDRLHGAPQVSGDRPSHPGDGIAIMHRPLSEGRSGRMYWNGGGKRAIWRHAVVHGQKSVRGQPRFHPTQKPVGLMEALIADFTDPGDLIVDPYAGSLTTALAARRLGRRCICIEGEEEWCEAGVKRLAQGILQLDAAP